LGQARFLVLVPQSGALLLLLLVPQRHLQLRHLADRLQFLVLDVVLFHLLEQLLALQRLLALGRLFLPLLDQLLGQPLFLLLGQALTQLSVRQMGLQRLKQPALR
jgi:hypothetical protein